MAQMIPVPAEVVRQMATEATDKVHRHREAGRKATAHVLEDQIGEAFSSIDGKDGEFVSIKASVISSLTAETTVEIPDYAEAAVVFLEQYNYW